MEADCVIGVPDSGIVGAMGYAHESGIPYELGLMKNRYIQRTFIESRAWDCLKHLSDSNDLPLLLIGFCVVC